MRKALGRVLTVTAIAYPIALIVVVILFRLVGERWWVTGVGLYLPRIGFAAPLPFLVIGSIVSKAWRLLTTQFVAAALVLFPLMGLVLSFPIDRDPTLPSLRILSFNVDAGAIPFDKIDPAISALSPDIVVLQELADRETPATLLRRRYPTVETSSQFLLASKFPILSTMDPERLPYGGQLRSPRFMQYVIDTPLGRIAVYNVHPLSPRGGLLAMRGEGLRREILSGRFFAGAHSEAMQEHSDLRELQVRAFTESAARESMPVIIAGDTNLPGSSAIFQKYLSSYRDGFAQVGNGFGYTFPSPRSWMRIDRILATDDFRFVGFRVGCRGLSDHRCIVADLQLRAR